MNISMKQKQTHRENKLAAAKGEEGQGRDVLGVRDQQMKTIVYRMEKQQGLITECREFYLISCDKP